MKIKILLADDHTIFRQGLKSLLSMEEDLEVVGEAGNGQEAVRLSEALAPHVILMDIAMPVLNGLSAAEHISANMPSIRVIILSGYDNDAYMLRASEAGAVGYMLKSDSIDEICDAIRSARKINPKFSPRIARRLADLKLSAFLRMGNDRMRRKNARTMELTLREMTILQLIAEGKISKEIAEILGIALKTVEHHRENLMGKLEIHDVVRLVHYAAKKGVVHLSPEVS